MSSAEDRGGGSEHRGDIVAGHESTPVNRLAGTSSPYLLLHRHNPVDWYPWGPEALEKARREDKPIFLSVGYSTCYWCHVMERESFSDVSTARLMNDSFVNIKLDREERPDLDEIYMTATQILTGHGGWPNSVFLTPGLWPFFAGTYFPPEDRSGQAGFPRVLRSMASAWSERRDDIESQAESLSEALRHHLEEKEAPAVELPSGGLAAKAYLGLERSFDPSWGGFGSAPKFPTPSNLFLLLEFADHKPAAAEMLTATLDHMARGGIFDQLGGGFHRYATDREWKIPHFEKMLYDNGLLLEVYAHELRRSGDPQANRVVDATAAFLLREMTAPEGAFWSALDAETDGHEGAFYVWTKDELLRVIGEEDFGFLAPLLGFDGPPFFEDDAFVLHLPQRLEQQADRRRMPIDDLLAEIEVSRRRLLEVRDARRRPLTDDKVLTDWNGMAIAGLAVAGEVSGRLDLVEHAAAAADFVLAELRCDGVLQHSWRQGRSSVDAFLADYAFLVRGLLALFRASGDERWRSAAEELTVEQRQRLEDPSGGFFTAADSADVLVRSKETFDGAVPAANSVAVLNLVELHALTGNGQWIEMAEYALRGLSGSVTRLPEAARMLTLAVHRVVGDGGGESEAVDGIAGEPVQADEDPVAVELEIGADPGDSSETGGWRSFELELRISAGWHIYDAYLEGEAPEWVFPTAVDVTGGELRRLELPPAEDLGSIAGSDPVLIHQGILTIRGEVRVEAGGRAELQVSFQPCDDNRCLAPVGHAFRI